MLKKTHSIYHLIGFTILVLTVVFSQKELKRLDSLKEWKTTQAKLISANALSIIDSDIENAHVLEVKYQFFVDSVKYIGTEYNCTNPKRGTGDTIRSAVRLLNDERLFQGYYNPKNPVESCMVLGELNAVQIILLWGFPLMSIPFFIIGWFKASK